MSHLSKKLIALVSILAAAVAAAVAALYFFVFSAQRSLTLIAAGDVSFYDGENRASVTFRLQKGNSVTVDGCRDSKSEIEPFTVLSNGQKAYLLSGQFEISKTPTGIFSRPQYLGCGDL
jgi:hypothetical protein